MNSFYGSAVSFHCDCGKRCNLAIFISAFRKVGETVLYLFSPVHFCSASHDQSWCVEHGVSCQLTPWPWMRFAWSLTVCNVSGILEKKLACSVVLVGSSCSLGLSGDMEVVVALKRRSYG